MDRDAWNARHTDPEREHLARPNRFLVEVVGDAYPGTAIDLAAGRGRNALWLAEQGWSVTAVDWSDAGLAIAREQAVGRGLAIQLEHADLAEWEPSLQYGLVLIAYLQVGKALREAVWRKAVRAVAPGGRLVVIGHDPENLERGHGGPQDPAAHYTAEEVVAVVAEDLEIERAERVLRPIDGDEGATAVDNVVVARRAR
jgi:SAM-dependent methyltransferase